MESKYGDRIEDQAAYFGISNEQVLELAKEASEFTKNHLSKPFRIWTRYRSAMGLTAGGRIYAFVVTAKGEDLNAALVANGLARIHGSRTPIPNGVTSRDYIARLTELEKAAKAQKRGGWRFTAQASAQPARPLTSPPTAPPAVLAPLYAASKKSAVFHKLDCASIDRIAEKNLVTYGSRADAIAAGKEPCSICKP